MTPNKSKRKRIISIDKTPEKYLVQVSRTKPRKVKNPHIILLGISIIIAILIAIYMPELRTKALELIITIFGVMASSFRR
jgi:hypothetical protein